MLGAINKSLDLLACSHYSSHTRHTKGTTVLQFLIQDIQGSLLVTILCLIYVRKVGESSGTLSVGCAGGLLCVIVRGA